MPRAFIAVVMTAFLAIIFSVNEGFAESKRFQLTPIKTLAESPRGIYYSALFTPGGDRICAVDMSGVIHEWDVATGRQVQNIQTRSPGYKTIGRGELAISPDGKMLAVANRGEIGFWNRGGATDAGTIRWQDHEFSSISYSPDGRFIAAGCYDSGEVRVWETSNFEVALTVMGASDGIVGVVFSPNGDELVIPDRDDTAVSVWHLKTKQRRAVLKGHPLIAGPFRFAPSGKTLACAGSELIRIWKYPAAEIEKTIQQPNVFTRCLEFSPDGNVLITAGRDVNFETPEQQHAIRLIEIENGGEVERFECHTHSVNSISLSSDGSHLVTSAHDGKVQLWKFEQHTVPQE